MGIRQIEVIKETTLAVADAKNDTILSQPIILDNHGFAVNLQLALINGGASTDIDVNYQLGYLIPKIDKSWVDVVLFKGSGLDDGTAGGTFTGIGQRNFLIEVDGTGTTDTFKWSLDRGVTWQAETVDMTIGTAIDLGDEGVTITFAAKTGHTSGASWAFTVSDIQWGDITATSLAANNNPLANSLPGVNFSTLAIKPAKYIRFQVENDDTNTAIVRLILMLMTKG